MQMQTRIEVSYNHKSSFSKNWCAGSHRFTIAEFVEWLETELVKSGAVLITELTPL